MKGNPPLKFGVYEAKASFDATTLWWALGMALASWGISYIVPLLEDSGETAAAFGAALAIILRILIEWMRDNTGKRHGSQEKSGDTAKSDAKDTTDACD